MQPLSEQLVLIIFVTICRGAASCECVFVVVIGKILILLEIWDALNRGKVIEKTLALFNTTLKSFSTSEALLRPCDANKRF